MEISAIALGGLQSAQAKFERSAARVASAGASDTVDLSSAAVDLLSAKNEFQLNIKMLKAADDMLKQTLDILA